jgi:hypothetical protein
VVRSPRDTYSRGDEQMFGAPIVIENVIDPGPRLRCGQIEHERASAGTSGQRVTVLGVDLPGPIRTRMAHCVAWHRHHRGGRQDRPLAKIHMTLVRIFTRTAVLSFGFAVAIGAAAEAQPLSTDRDMVTGVSVTEADGRTQTGRLWVRAKNRGFCVRFGGRWK